MATSANMPPGAVAANASTDPFVNSPTHPPSAALRYAPFEDEDFASYSTNSPAAARRALEAHLKDTDRRIQDASRLGTTLLQQRKDLAARLKEVEQVNTENEVPTELREKLVELEREYNQVGRESARAFLPKTRAVSEMQLQSGGGATALSAQSRDSSSKQAAPSRRQRNQPVNRIHDIEFATEISTSLLAQVRQLQAALAEKDEALKETSSLKAKIEAETTALLQRVRHMDETEQKYKDENWNLELRLQEIESNLKQSSDKETRLTQALKSTEAEKAAKERELDELKLIHDRTLNDHSMARKVQEADLHGLRRDASYHESEKQKLQSKIAELTAQNTELAKAVSYRWAQAAKESDTDFVSAEEGHGSDDQAGEQSDAGSPIKGTPARHGMLESETLKSSLNHAHRMIQNLKNNIHREKTEKIELKRMLQDARDELESRRDHGTVAANMAKKRKELDAAKFKKPLRPDRLGATRASTTEIVTDEPDWEDAEGERTPSKSYAPALLAGAAAGTAAAGIYGHSRGMSTDTETEAFQTADERNTATESEAFATGAEDFDEDTEGDLTETEDRPNRDSSARNVSGVSTLRGDRRSFLSTASTSADEDEEPARTPIQNAPQAKYKVRLSRGSKRFNRVSDLISDSPTMGSPSSSTGTPATARGLQSLEDELGALDDNSIEGTPVNSRSLADEMFEGTPNTEMSYGEEPVTPSRGSVAGAPSSVRSAATSHRAEEDLDVSTLSHAEVDQTVLVHALESPAPARETPVHRAPMVDVGMMTDPWEPKAAPGVEPSTSLERTGEIVGSALAGIGLGSLLGRKSEQNDSRPESQPEDSTVPESPVTVSSASDKREKPADSSSGPHEPEVIAAPARAVPAPLAFSQIMTQELEPVEVVNDIVTPVLPVRSPRRETEDILPDTLKASKSRPVQSHDLDDPFDTTASESARAGHEHIADAPAVADRHELGEDAINEQSTEATLGELSPNVTVRRSVGMLPVTKALQIKKQVVDEGSQTVMSSKEIDMLREKALAPTVVPSVKDAGVSPMTPPRTTAAGVPSVNAPTIVVPNATSVQAPRRPSSAGSTRSRSGQQQPPLPADHTQKIAAAALAPAAAVGSMGPPLMPASAYRASRPRTPVGEKAADRTASRDGPTPRPGRGKDGRNQPQSSFFSGASEHMSHRGSVSSFASELDDRFSIPRGHILYPNDLEPATDPRMIQAITQTMIGEYLWKYTRKTGRSETSNTRHRRFFWVHPYTRTLYWSENDPSTAGKNMVKAKSVAIDSVRVITDDNVFPPGLHRKSLVVVTPGREIVFTAPSGQRHETWLNALSYLLLKTEQEKQEAEDAIADEDLDEFRPGFGRTVRGSFSRMSNARSLSRHSQGRVSMSSQAGRTRAASPHRAEAIGSLVQRQSMASQKSRTGNGMTASSITSATKRDNAGSVGARISSLANRFRPSSRGRSSLDKPRNAGDPAQFYDSNMGDSAEDIRAQLEQQDRNADLLENVRACCDGKHDVGSLSRTGRNSFGSRLAGHTHSHASDTMKSRT